MFETYYNPLLRFAYRFVKSESIAEGLVQDVFLWIWENREAWNVEGNLKTYLFRAVKYKAIDYWRKEQTKATFLEQLSFESENRSSLDLSQMYNEDVDEFAKAVQITIEELPERPRLIYKLNRLEGLTYLEIADVLEISVKTVESHMSRAIGILKNNLEKYNRH